jgi:hypothetical protein
MPGLESKRQDRIAEKTAEIAAETKRSGAGSKKLGK